MEMSLLNKGGEVWTRIKVSNTEMSILPKSMKTALWKPVKKSSRYTYFEVKDNQIQPGVNPFKKSEKV